jgi:UDP-galactopyranose mutase
MVFDIQIIKKEKLNLKRVLVVGCGLYGATVARLLCKNFRVYLIDKRNHIGGNCYSEFKNNIHVHKYGPHAFHTNSVKIWDFIRQYSDFNDFRLKVIVNYDGKYYNFPINLITLNNILGIKNLKEAEEFIQNRKENNQNFQDFVISKVGVNLYKIFYEGYTTKQWNKNPIELPASIAKRIPIRLDFDENYFTDKYQGVPINGYTRMFENMLDHKNIEFNLNVDFFDNKKSLINDFDHVIYTGKIDQFFDYQDGVLEYRSLKFREEYHDSTFQGNAQINYTNAEIPYTRIVEHKFFHNPSIKHTIVTYEYPDDYNPEKIPYYPIETENNKLLYFKYKSLADEMENFTFGGRLGTYSYMNMDQIIGKAMNDCEKINI